MTDIEEKVEGKNVSPDNGNDKKVTTVIVKLFQSLVTLQLLC